MPAIIAAIAGGAAFGQSYLSGKKQKQQRRRYGRRFQRALGATEAIQGRSLSQQEALSRQATQQTLGGYDTARKEASRLGRQGMRDVLDRETQLLGRASQGLTQSGLGSTTLGANLQRGIASSSNRDIAGIREGQAELYGNLALGRAGAEAAGTQELSGFAAQRGDLMSQLAQMGTMRDLYGASPWGGGGPMPEREGNIGANLLTGVQTGVGMYAGMGGQIRGQRQPMGRTGSDRFTAQRSMMPYLFDLEGTEWQNIGSPMGYSGMYG